MQTLTSAWWSGAQTSSAPGALPPSARDTVTLEQRLIRVTRADISAVTADDIRRVRAALAPEDLTASLRIVLETNRFADVLASSSASTWAEAAAAVTEVQMSECGRVMRDRLSLLYSILPHVSDNFLSAMGSPFTDNL
ncbi:hypothetical protein NESM_000278700 [Novymonas esmeraldas]|uniref:Uncharacterized protein n=1 Tax=Novymonas esmeraldas TaxID=1808958 RepID=A0AAW0F9A0_9TRYP